MSTENQVELHGFEEATHFFGVFVPGTSRAANCPATGQATFNIMSLWICFESVYGHPFE